MGRDKILVACRKSSDKGDSMKPILHYNPSWSTGFDFWPAIRDVLRPLHLNDLCRNIEKEIVKSDTWKNMANIKEILESYFTMKKDSEMPIIYETRKAYSISDGERKRRGERMKKLKRNR